MHALLLALLIAPVFSYALTVEDLKAQIEALIAQIQTLQRPTTVERVCPNLTRSLARGVRGEDVRELQLFLASLGHFEEEATGYFGAITEASVGAWQIERGIVAARDSNLGWGIVGPKSRAEIQKQCGQKSTSPISSATATSSPPKLECPAAPKAKCIGTWEGVKLANGCTRAWRCVEKKVPGAPPRILEIEGPSQLSAGGIGRFIVRASDPGDILEYRIVWGEGGDTLGALEAIAGEGVFFASNVFSHAYASPGFYIITATVRDSEGLETRLSTSVTVVSSDVPCTSCASFLPLPPLSADAALEIRVPEGITSCATPWEGLLVRSGGMVDAGRYFRGSVASTTAVMRCNTGKWERCNSSGANCIPHTLQASNPLMKDFSRYAEAVGSGCSGYGTIRVVRAEARSLLCANVIHQVNETTQCAYTQEDTAIQLSCYYNNWGEVLTVQ